MTNNITVNPSTKLAVQRLNNFNAYEFFRHRAMPEHVKPDIESLLDWYLSDSIELHEITLKEFTAEAGQAFSWYARRSAAEAVRFSSADILRRGLLSAVISAEVSDIRDAFSVISLLNNSGALLHIDLLEMLKNLKFPISYSINAGISQFLTGALNQISIQSFGFHEGTTENGEFQYIPAPVDEGGASPFDN